MAAGDELILAQTALAERTLDLQRLQAEFLNYKRRVDRDRELVKQNAIYAVLSGDARRSSTTSTGPASTASSRAASRPSPTRSSAPSPALGLTKFGAKGDEFDPNLHEALMHGALAGRHHDHRRRGRAGRLPDR